MRRMVAVGGSDQGQVRAANEDAWLVLDSVYAVADGMGGHVAGEVASAAALEPVRELDGRVFAGAEEALAALREAVIAANHRVTELAEQEPTYRGMGTTLTAAMLEGRRLHVAHVGDSRAYLLRDGVFSQLTDDHTLVQHLVDEGQLTREQAQHHPKRSIITRAIGVSRDLEVDSMSLELEPGDQLLLCSDGLTGVVEDADIAATLAGTEDPDDAVAALITQANDGGGPDNITVVLLRYEDPDAPPRPPRTISISTRDDRRDENWAGRLGSYGIPLSRGADPEASEEEESRTTSRILGRAVAIVLGLVVIAGLVLGGGRFLLNQSFYVGVEGQRVVIYQGIDRTLGPFELSRVVERTELELGEVAPWYRPSLEAGRTAADLNDARRIVNNAPRRADMVDDPDAADPDADGPGTADPDAADPGAAIGEDLDP